MTNRLSAFVIDLLRSERSFTSVAKVVDLSVTTVTRIFDIVSHPELKLPQVLAIDEFKGNTDNKKYQCILTDPVNVNVKSTCISKMPSQRTFSETANSYLHLLGSTF